MPSLQSVLFRAAMHAATRTLRGATDVAALRSGSQNLLKAPKAALLTPLRIDELPARWISAPGASDAHILLYLHGGGFVQGYSNVYDHLCYQLSRAMRMRVLAIDYRLAPEHPFPAALDDSVAAYRWLLQQGYAPGQIIIAGDSAGGNLTLASLLALKQAGDSLPAGGIAISPATDSALTGESLRTRATVDPILSVSFIKMVAAMYAGTTDRRDPLLSPLYAEKRGLPPLLIHVGDQELLLSDGERFAAEASAEGVDVTLKIWPAMWHDFQMCAPWLPEARRSLAEMATFAAAHLPRASGSCRA